MTKEKSLYDSFREIYEPEDEIPDVIKRKYKKKSCLKHTAGRRVYLMETVGDECKKVILKCADGVWAEQVRNEAYILRYLGGDGAPLLLQWIDAGDGRVYLIREYIEGVVLQDVVEREGVLDERDAVELMMQLCCIVERLHRMTPPVICRDITPSNIIRTESGNYMLIDYDAVREFRQDAKKDTRCIGTADTAAPEQYGFGQTDERTDIYGLGMLLLYVTAGTYHEDENKGQNLPKRLRKIIDKCIAFDPGARYSSVGQLVHSLNRMKGYRWHRRAAVYVMLAVLLIGGGWIGSRGKLPVGEGKQPTQEGGSDAAAGIQWKNSRLEEAARSFLHKEEGEYITKEELDQVTTVILCGDQVFSSWEEHEQYHNEYWYEWEKNMAAEETADLSELSYFKNLKVLVLDNQGLEDVPDLSGLPLKKLSICKNRIENLDGVEELTELKILWVNGNPLYDISAVESLTELTEFDCSRTAVSDLSPLSELRLTSLYCQDTLADSSEAAELAGSLVNFRISEADEAAIRKISQNTGLRMLGLYYSELTSLEQLSTLKNLESLDVTGCGELDSLDGIENLKKLDYLGIVDTGVKELPPDLDLPRLGQIEIRGLDLRDYTPLKNCPSLKKVFVDMEEKQILEEKLGDSGIEIVGIQCR